MKTNCARFRNVLQMSAGAILALSAAATLCAQSPAVRIGSEINSSDMTVIRGTQLPQANPQFDAGRMPAGTRLSGVSIYFKRSAAQQSDLLALLAAQQDPASPLYHQWLTPDQFAARFGMAAQDVDTVQTWLRQQGFSIDYVNRSRNAIHFSGSVGQIESAFQTQMHFYVVNGEKHYAPSTALSVPAAMASVVQNVTNLSDFRPRPMHISARPGFTSAQSGNVFFAPGDIKTAYDMAPLISGGNNGAGQTIAIMGQSYVKVADMEAFESAASLPKKDPTLVLMPGSGSDGTASAGDESESDLDLEWSGAMAPGANLAFVYTGSNTNYGVYDSASYAVDQKIGNIISLSYSSCETQLTAANLTQLEGLFQQANAQGQTVMAASGDSGSTSCSGNTNLTTAQQEAEVVNYPASSAYVTGVGGTEISAANSVSTNTTYWIAASGSDVLTSAKTYIPEVAWNDDSTQYGLSASGGGKSSLVSRPSWQTGVPGIPSGSMRLVPDIAFYSSPNYPGYLYCTSDTSQWQTASGVGSQAQQASCNSGFRDSATQDLNVAGGTSFATPIFAGMLADINQALNYTTGQGNINPVLYQLAANSTTYSTAFHDVKSGNNNCTAGSTYCSGTAGYAAGAGYDEVTGLGSIDVGNIATVWPLNTGASAALMATNTAVVPANATPVVNTADTFTITVASETGSTIPTGTVTLQVDGGPTYGGTTVSAQALSANGTVTYAATFASAGTHQIVAQYSGDATHAASTGVGEVAIAVTSSGKGTFAMVLSPSTLTVKQGAQGTETLTVTPSGGYTGTITLNYTSSNSTALANLCLYSVSGFDSNGDIAVSGTSPAVGVFTVDTKAADCSTTTGGLKPHTLLLHARNATHAGNNAPPRSPLPAGIALGGLLLAGLLGRSSRKLRGLACVIALAMVTFGLSACGNNYMNGNGSGGGGTATNPPTGTYTLTFTGQDSVTATNTASGAFTLTIN